MVLSDLLESEHLHLADAEFELSLRQKKHAK